MDQSLHQPDEMAGYLSFLMHKRRVESSASLLQHFGFQEDPFRVSPDPRYMYPSKTHLQALASLENGFYNNRGFIAMIAPPGMGKTTLLYRFLEDTQETARSVFLFDIDADCQPRDFVSYILREFGISPASTSSEMHSQLGDALVKETDAGRKCVVVIDEAQNLSDAVLERVRLLTNFETSQGKLLQIILSGQPQLADNLLHPSLVQLRQRVSTFCRLELLSADETVAYIDYRLRQAGYRGDPLFSEDALKLIAENGKGTPRTINNLCYNSLALCSEIKSKQVDADMVAKVVASLQLSPESGEFNAAAGRVAGKQPGLLQQLNPLQRARKLWDRVANTEVNLWIPATAVVLILAALGVFRLGGIGTSQHPDMSQDRTLDVPNATDSAPASATPIPPKVMPAKPAQNTKTSDRKNKADHHRSASASSSALLATMTQPDAADQSTAEVAGAVAAPLQQTPAIMPPLDQAALSIDSNPRGADIEIDGAFIGSTPSTVTLAAGTHRVTVHKRGYEGWNRILSVSSGTVHLNAELEHAPPRQ